MLVNLRTPIILATLEILIPYPRDLPAYAKDGHNKKVQSWGVKYNMMHDQEHVNPINPYKLFY
jgi:hypothetical protein